MKGCELMSKSLSINELNVSIKNRQILFNITFDVDEGEIIGLLGPNGSGKTTTIKTMAGLIKKNSGTISSFDKTIDCNFEEYIRQISFCFDKANYYPFLTGYENLKFFVDTYRKCMKSEILQCVEEIGLSNRIFDKISTYSFGMKQRLNFAKSILTGSKIIVLDEPFNGIDPAGVVEMREIIQRLRKEKGISFVISSHLLNEIESVSSRLLFYKSGVIVRNICVKEYKSFNHYISIANPNALFNVALFQQYKEVSFASANTIKVVGSNTILNEVLHFLYVNGYIVASVSSKHAIEDLYIKTVGGDQVE